MIFVPATQRFFLVFFFPLSSLAFSIFPTDWYKQTVEVPLLNNFRVFPLQPLPAVLFRRSEILACGLSPVFKTSSTPRPWFLYVFSPFLYSYDFLCCNGILPLVPFIDQAPSAPVFAPRLTPPPQFRDLSLSPPRGSTKYP